MWGDGKMENLLWSSLSECDELSSSTAPVLNLLAKALSRPGRLEVLAWKSDVFFVSDVCFVCGCACVPESVCVTACVDLGLWS